MKDKGAQTAVHLEFLQVGEVHKIRSRLSYELLLNEAQDLGHSLTAMWHETGQHVHNLQTVPYELAALPIQPGGDLTTQAPNTIQTGG